MGSSGAAAGAGSSLCRPVAREDGVCAEEQGEGYGEGKGECEEGEG